MDEAEKEMRRASGENQLAIAYREGFRDGLSVGSRAAESPTSRASVFYAFGIVALMGILLGLQLRGLLESLGWM